MRVGDRTSVGGEWGRWRQRGWENEDYLPVVRVFLKDTARGHVNWGLGTYAIYTQLYVVFFLPRKFSAHECIISHKITLKCRQTCVILCAVDWEEKRTDTENLKVETEGREKGSDDHQTW